jgi:fused signal recognition particle receptor
MNELILALQELLIPVLDFLGPHLEPFNALFGEDAPFVLGSGLAVLLVLLVLALRRRSKPLSPEETEDAEREKYLLQLEKERLKDIERRDKDAEKQLEKQRQEKLSHLEARERETQEELRRKEEELRQKRSLSKEIPKTEPEPEPEPEPESFLERLKQGIGKTRKQLLGRVEEILHGKKEIDEEVLDDLEEVLISADIGPETTGMILEAITEQVERKELQDPAALQSAIRAQIEQIMSKEVPVSTTEDKKPLVLLFVGVNGVGKTTTIGKLAAQYVREGKKVLMGAGDTFRAAAIEQLGEWSQRAQCDLISKEAGADPSAVLYETVEKGLKDGHDVIICDTAGRLHTKKNLMEELKKMVRVIRKLIPDAPHEVLLVLDATTGQNAIFQAREFKDAAELTGIVITKLDGTSKGGVVIGIVNEFDIPVRYIGIGEKVEDLRPFDARQFTESLFA